MFEKKNFWKYNFCQKKLNKIFFWEKFLSKKNPDWKQNFTEKNTKYANKIFRKEFKNFFFAEKIWWIYFQNK